MHRRACVCMSFVEEGARRACRRGWWSTAERRLRGRGVERPPSVHPGVARRARESLLMGTDLLERTYGLVESRHKTKVCFEPEALGEALVDSSTARVTPEASKLDRIFEVAPSDCDCLCGIRERRG
jgi:hypothetical protein